MLYRDPSREDFRTIPSFLRLEVMKYVKPKVKPKLKNKEQYFKGVSGKHWRLTRCIYCNDPRAWSKVTYDGKFYNFNIIINCSCFSPVK